MNVNKNNKRNFKMSTEISEKIKVFQIKIMIFKNLVLIS